MKREYVKPAMEIVEVEATKMICTSDAMSPVSDPVIDPREDEED